MNKETLKKAIMIVVPMFSVAMNLWGILSLLHINHFATLPGLSYLDAPRLILKYVIIVITMIAGIMSASLWAGQLVGKARNVMSIAICTYSTILTIPLFLTFLLSFFVAGGTSIPLVNEITWELMDIFQSPGWYNTIFALGTIMGIAFLAVPIIMTVQTVKKPLKEKL